MENSPGNVWGIIWAIRDWVRYRWSIGAVAGVMKRLRINYGVVIGLGTMEKIYFTHTGARTDLYDIKIL